MVTGRRELHDHRFGLTRFFGLRMAPAPHEPLLSASPLDYAIALGIPHPKQILDLQPTPR